MTEREPTDPPRPVLVLGIGNVLMGDEGVGVEVVRRLERLDLPPGVTCLDGGTGGFQLLGQLQAARRIVLIDATADGREPGSVVRLRPRFSTDYPRTLTAHDIGLKDLLDAFYLLGTPADVTLFAVSIRLPQTVGIGLSPELERRLEGIVDRVRAELSASDPDGASVEADSSPG